MAEKIYYIIYWWMGLLYTVRDDGGNTSIYDAEEADKKIADLKENVDIQWIDKKEMEPCP